MGIWQHTHTITTTEVSPDLGEFTEILDDVNVELIQSFIDIAKETGQSSKVMDFPPIDHDNPIK